MCGSSSYSRIIDFSKFYQISQEVNAYLCADIAHIAGLVIANLHPSPVDYAHFVTSTTHKTLRGPRGGLILCRKEFSEKIDSAIFPGIQGGPLVHVIAGKAVAFREAMKKSFIEYQRQIFFVFYCIFLISLTIFLKPYRNYTSIPLALLVIWSLISVFIHSYFYYPNSKNIANSYDEYNEGIRGMGSLLINKGPSFISRVIGEIFYKKFG